MDVFMGDFFLKFFEHSFLLYFWQKKVKEEEVRWTNVTRILEITYRLETFCDFIPDYEEYTSTF